MEKTPTYHHIKKGDGTKFISKATSKKVQKEDVKKEEKESCSALTVAQQPIPPAFAVVNPIPSIFGPVGEFVMKPESFPMHPSVVDFGKRRTGKSFTFRWILYNCFRDIPFGVVLTNTSFNGFWQKHFPARFVYQGLREDIMEGLMTRQKKAITKWEKENPGKDYKMEPSLRVLIVLDDVIADKVAMLWNKNINTFFVEGRHLCISVFITSQHVKGIGPMMRGNMDIVILQPIFQTEARRVLHDLYGGWTDYHEFEQFLNEVVLDEELPDSTAQVPHKRVRSLVINDYQNTTNPQMKFRWMEADDPGDFRLLHPLYWKEVDNNFGSTSDLRSYTTNDVVDELDETQCLQNIRF